MQYFSFEPDFLSIWFICIISLIFLNGAFYGADYLQAYRKHRKELVLHGFFYILTYLSMIALTLVGDAVSFLVTWEIMALGSFFLIIFESWKGDVIKAGLNFFIQSHISVVLLSIGFAIMYIRTGSFFFEDWAHCTESCLLPFALICAGFAIKAGFVPFHTWLPVAHPAAPAHISGVMSGVIIKIGIYGIIRMVLIFAHNLILNESMLLAGKVILAVAAISGLYGVMMAIVQHNLKKLLAYHSIENIGIIGMGIGLYCIGLGTGIGTLASLGLAGALLHTLNHALFKSNLFFAAGNVYQAAHDLNVEHLGGLVRKLPLTAFLFLVSAVAICGLPPLNGFVSEILIYLGLFDFMGAANPLSGIGAAGAIAALVLIGGLAILCFTKAFGVVFLGESRTELPEHKEFSALRLAPMFGATVIMFSIGLFPELYVSALNFVLEDAGVAPLALNGTITMIGRAATLFCILVLVLGLIRTLCNGRRKIETGPTWGCGYPVESPKLQYTATSFVKTYSSLFSAVLRSGLTEKLAKAYIRFTGRLAFLENGRLQSYILYGIVFIILTIILSLTLC
ncbi:MAG: hydrogenase [Bacteroidales bacterium]|nr:hydrogenase [Bacteroidales bacterium]